MRASFQQGSISPGVSASVTITSTSPLSPPATQNQAYTYTFAASGGNPPYTWALISGSIPGLTLSSGGVLSGTPTNTGTDSFSIQATDNSGNQSAVTAFNLVVSTLTATTLVHGANFTITGSGFGTKSAPIVSIRDTQSDAALDSAAVSPQWSTALTTPATLAALSPPVSSFYAMQNRAPGFKPTTATISAPHPFVPGIMAGNAVHDVSDHLVQTNILSATTQMPFVIYASWYERCTSDSLFFWPGDSSYDNNFKTFAWGMGTSYLGGSPNVDMYSNIDPTTGSTITGITLGNPTVVAVSTQVFTVGATAVVTATSHIPISGIPQILNIPITVTAKTGAAGAAGTVSLNIDSTSFTPWTSGGYLGTGGCEENQTSKVGVSINPTEGIGFQSPDANGHGSFWSSVFNPFNPANGWVKNEIAFKVSSTAATRAAGGGYFYQWNICTQGAQSTVIGYEGSTDAGSTSQSSTRYMALGGYWRNVPGPTVGGSAVNWRCFSDFYVDSTSGSSSALDVARLVIGNAATFDTCTVREPAKIVTWANGSVTATFWQGGLTTGGQVYPYLTTEAGVQSLISGTFVVGTPLTLTTGSLPIASIGMAYHGQLSASGGTAPYTYSMSYCQPNTGTWLTCSSSGALSGTPTTAETETCTFTVKDANGLTYTTQTLTVTASTFSLPAGPPGGAIDYYISTTGSDSNPGTFAQPWAITSMQRTTANNNKMGGKRIGIIEGTYTNITWNDPQYPGNNDLTVINTPVGTAAYPNVGNTWIGSVSATDGTYKPRSAILIDNRTDRTSGNQNAFVGLGLNTAGAVNITIDGLTINANGSSSVYVVMLKGGTGSYTGPPFSGAVCNFIVQNCEIYGISYSDSGNNPCLVFVQDTSGAIIRNNWLHNVQCPGSDPSHCHAMECYTSQDTQFIYNTISNTHGGGQEDKVGNTGTIAAYNYFYNCTGSDSANMATFQGYDGGEGNPNPANAGHAQNVQIHHNILDSCRRYTYGEWNNANHYMPYLCYNNTVYEPAATRSGWNLVSAAGAIIQYHDNVIYAPAATAVQGLLLSSGGYSTLDYNAYFAASLNSMWHLGGTAYSTLANWKTATSAEVHSVSGSTNPFPAAIVAGGGTLQFQPTAGSPLLGSGTAGANMGAWDGSTQQVGCSWLTYPISPTA